MTATPQTPEEHHAEAVALLNDAAALTPHSASALVLATRAAAHASLALYRPPVTFATGAIVAESDIPTPRRAARKTPAKKETTS